MKNLHLLLFAFLFAASFSLKSQSSLWGVTTTGGNGAGTIFGLPTGNTSVTAQYNMTDNSGSAPAFTKLLEVNGKLYGTTVAGGSSNVGVMFEYDPVTNAYKILASFTGTGGSFPGSSPSALIQASSNSKLYGVTKLAGANGNGNIFSYDLTTKTYSVLASFTGTTGAVLGSQPVGGLLEASDGKLYGTSNRGGSSNIGVIYRIDPATNTYSMLASFTGTTGAGIGNNNLSPINTLIEGSVGKLNGVTYAGGANNVGVLYEYNISTGSYTNLHDFIATSGSNPATALCKASNGKLYGTTNLGGANSVGTIFEYDLVGLTYTKDFDMASSTGSNPFCALMQASNGKLYGTTKTGGANSAGALFEYDITGATYTKKYDFILAQGSVCQSSLIQYSGNGKLYSMTQSGGSGSGGVIFEYDISLATYTKKIDLNVSTGGQPNGAMTLSSSNNKLYGMSYTGGSANSGGVIYEYDYTTNTYAKKSDLITVANGRFPYGALTQVSSGNFYGLMSAGGTSGFGTLIKYTAGATTFTKVVDFTGANGATPYGSVVQATTGVLYGLTSAGGANSVGAIFSYDVATSTYAKLYDFSAANGSLPYGSPMIASNGKIYGMTSAGGANGYGVVFEYDITTSTYTKKIDLTQANGSNPYGSLVQANGNFLYGMTSTGGANSVGAIFEYDITNSTYTKKVDLSSTNPTSPYGSMTKAASGKLYGLTTTGGTNNVGVMFEYDPATVTYTKKIDLSLAMGGSPGFTQLTEICTLPTTASAITATSAICQGNSTAQNFSISNITNATSYTMTIPSGASVTTGSGTNIQSIDLSGVSVGVYTLSAGGINACGTGTLSSKTITVNTLPTLSVSSGTICSGNSFTITPSGASVYTIQGGAMVVSPTITTNYTLTGADVNGCLSALPATVNVAVNSTPNISVNSGSICTGNSYTINPSGANSYTITGGTFTVNPSTTTSYSVTGTATNGCASTATIISTVTVNPIPSISVNGGSICSGTSFSIVPSGAYTYTVTGNSFNVSPVTSTDYSVTGTSLEGCAASNTAIASVSVSASPSISVNSGSICSGSSFSITPNGATTYTITGGNFAVTPYSTTSYSVAGSGANGCVSDTAVSTVSVFVTPTVGANSASICSGDIYTISPTGADNYTITGGSFNVSPSITTTYSVSGSSTAGCISTATAVITLSVNTSPTISVNSGSICSGQSFTVNPNGADTYAISGNSFVITPNATAYYSVIGSSTAGCVSSVMISTVTVFTTPSITASSGSICTGDSYTIAAGGASTYTVAGGSFVVAPASTTSYSVSGTSTDGCISSTVNSTVTVNAVPTITVNSGSLCMGDQFTITPGGANTYTVTGGSFNVSPTANTSYSVTGTSTAGCISSVAAVADLTVNALPNITINTSSAICIGSTATLVANAINTFTWNWSPVAATGATLTDSPSSTTIYSVTGTNLSGCSSIATATVVVNQLPTISIASGAVCPGNSFTLSPTGATTYTYSGGSDVVFPTTTTSYSVYGTDINGCSSTLAAVATITVATTLPVAVSGSTSICSGDNTLLIAGGASTYSWSTGALTANITVSPTSSTIYTVTGSSGTCSTTVTFTLAVVAKPNVVASVPSATICLGETTVLSGSGANTYLWVNTSQTTSTIAVGPITNTTYTLIGAANSCTNEASVTVNVSTCLGLVNLSQTSPVFSAYPNPNNGEFSVETSKALTIVVLNPLGEVILTQQLQEGANSINISKQAKGLYFIQALDNKQFKAIRIAIQ